MPYTIDEKKVIYADLDPSEGVVLNLESKDYYRLNETGQIIWQGLAAKKSAKDIVTGLIATYDVTEAEASEDVETLIHQMRKEQLIQG